MSKKKKKPVKKVTAPVTYDPGKGRPKEYLAYLNWEEMEALRRLNGEGPYPGPKGLPSFVLGGATTSGTAANRAMSSAAQSNRASPTTRAPGASAAAAKASASRPSGSSSVSRISGGTAGSNQSRFASGTASRGGTASTARISGGVAGSNQSRFASGTTSRGAASTARISGGTPGGNQRDAQVRQAAAIKDASKAFKSPALKQDTGRSAIGGISKDKSVGLADGSKIRGAIKGVQESAAQVARKGGIGSIEPTVTMSQEAVVPGFTTSFEDQRNEAKALRDVMQSQIGFGDSPFTENIDKTIRVLAGETGAKGVGAGEAANVMINRTLINNYASQFGLPRYNNNLYNTKQWEAPKAPAYGQADPGSRVAGDVARSAIKGLMDGPQAPYATDFRAVKQPGGKKTQKTGVDVGGNRYGNYEGVSAAEMASLRGSLGSSPGVNSVGFVAENATRKPLNSLVSAGVEESVDMRPARPAALFGGKTLEGKPITDRIRPTYPTLSEDPTLPGKRTKTIYDRVTPGTDPVRAAMVSEIASASPSYFKLGAPNERMLYNASPETERRMRDVFRGAPSVGRSAVTPTYMRAPGLTVGRSAVTPSYMQTPNLTTGRSVVNPVRTPPDYARIASDPTRTPTSYPRIAADPTRTPANYPRISADPTESERILKVENLMSDAGIRKTVNPMMRSKQIRDRVYPSIPEPDSMGMLPPERLDAANVGGVIGGAIRAARAAPAAFEAVSDALKTVGTAIGQYSKASTGILGVMGGKSLADKAVTEYAQGAIKSGAQKIAALQETYNKAVNDAAKAGGVPSPRNEEVTDIENGLTTVGLAEGEKLSQENAPTRVQGGLGFLAYEPAPGSKRVYNIKPSVDTESRNALYQGNYGEETASEYLDPSEALPRYVDPEAQKEMKRQENLNKIGTRVIKSRNPAAQAGDAVMKLITGQGIADNTAALKRQYMQSSPEQQAALERQYPNLTRFAADVGLTPQLPMSNYTNWADMSGLRAPSTREGAGGDISFGIASLGGGSGNDNTGGTDGSGGSPGGGTGGGSGSSSGGQRPYIYYEWDLGVNIPSPGDPNYTMYMTYLAERQAASQAMYG